ncbi:arylsulfatase [Flavivirga amylovorans]|uniref:Arylsulfatase n=1 Tax=Flavivirga amylovorans TaxID=870486 RepID=A0ABT8WWW2_9FLAO|nr:arylsulfatase [Flavivirga amylovorans]MDO5986174.1 arylsulfatase [Flavivirga amylovorans]
MKTSMKLLGIFILLIFSCNAKAKQKNEAQNNDAPPNVIVILTDDQGYGDLSIHGNPYLKTPNLDVLHAESVRLTDFHVAPVCTPTRGQLLTGQDAMHNGAWSWAYGHEMIKTGHKTIADIFKANGYATGHFGKWHLGENYPYRPQDKGFDETVTHGGGSVHQSPDYWQNDNFDDHYHDKDGKWRQYKGYCTDVWFDLSMDFMKRKKVSGEPFFLYLPTNAPHGPHYVAEKYKEPYKDIKVTGRHNAKKVASFFGMISNFDENMGRLETFLHENGLKENTILVFLTDNGGTAGVYVHNAGMKGYKSQYYDGGHRVPCFIRWPKGNLKHNTSFDQLTHVQDILPTLMDLCKLESDDEIQEKLDGVSLEKLITGEQASIDDRKLVVQWTGLDEPTYGKSAVLWNKWRLVHNKELYNVSEDIGQKHDVANEHPNVVKKMQDHYKEWWNAITPEAKAYAHIGIGGEENPVMLSCFDWTEKTTKANVTLQTPIWSGDQANGKWKINAEKAGTYRFELRRYPASVNAELTKALPEVQEEYRKFPACIAMPIASARLKVGTFDKTIAVSLTDKAAIFEVNLPKGNSELKTWFLDASGNELSGAYYTDIFLIK